MVEFKDRLRLAMEHAQVGREALRAKLKVSRVAVDKLLDGRSKSMSAENCAHAAQFLGVDMYWLATGAGPMLAGAHHAGEPRPTYSTGNVKAWPMETVTLEEYLTLSDRQQGHIEGQIRALLDVKSNGGRHVA